jgi:pimeloyl-ACP methyl ester carboxylesterase
MGQSRGGELSLILASLLRDEINQVIARVPSHIVWAQRAPSWIYQGAPLKHISMLSVPEIIAELEQLKKKGDFIAPTPFFMKALAQLEEASKDATIEVEKFNGKILLISGEDDQMWPSSWFSDRVVERMHAYGKGDQIKHLRYPNAGHLIPVPYFPTTVHDMFHAVEGMKYKNGGTDEGDAMAAEDSWMQIRRFISEA